MSVFPLYSLMLISLYLRPVYSSVALLVGVLLTFAVVASRILVSLSESFLCLRKR